jgi:CO/xanthine dehydrogenase FAD-binding subunit
MKPARFDYVAPTTLGEAISLLKEHEANAKVLAGGQSLVPLLNMRLARPAILIDLNGIRELDYIREVNGQLAIGAMTRKRAVEHSSVVKTRQPLLHAATLQVAHAQIRNRGTVGGSLAHADPAAEYPAVAVALDAELQTVGPQGERTLRAADFFVTYLTTALAPTELLTEVRVPVQPRRTGWSFLEISRRRGDFAMAGVAVTVGLDSGGRCREPRIALFGVGPTPVRARQAEDIVDGENPGETLIERAAERVTEEIDEPLSDVHASAEYRRTLARVLTRRALAEAIERAGNAS